MSMLSGQLNYNSLDRKQHITASAPLRAKKDLCSNRCPRVKNVNIVVSMCCIHTYMHKCLCNSQMNHESKRYMSGNRLKV